MYQVDVTLNRYFNVPPVRNYDCWWPSNRRQSDHPSGAIIMLHRLRLCLLPISEYHMPMVKTWGFSPPGGDVS